MEKCYLNTGNLFANKRKTQEKTKNQQVITIRKHLKFTHFFADAIDDTQFGRKC